MQQIEVENAPPLARPVLSECPQCNGELAVLRVIGGRGGCQYWTMRCARCGAIHLDILKSS